MESSSRPRWKAPHALSVVAALLSLVTLVTNQLHGKPVWFLEPTPRNERHSGWPVAYMKCPDSIMVPTTPDYFLGFHYEEWSFLTSKVCEFNSFALVGDIVVCSAILFGLFVGVEQFCVAHNIRLRFSFAGMFAFAGWLATVLVMTSPSIMLDGYYITFFEQTLYVVLALTWMGWTSICFGIATRWISRST